MADESPVDLGILQLLDADLAGESAIRLIEDVLGSNAELFVGELAGEGEVEGGRGDDDLGGGVEFSGVEVVNDGLDALDGAVPGEGVSGRKSRGCAWYRGAWIEYGGASRGKQLRSYILKFPPTKNWRGIVMVLGV